MEKVLSKFKIGKKWIGGGEPLYFIAEAGVNYENDIDVAYKMIKEAAKSGADAIKFQSYKADSLASKFSPAYWDRKREPTKSQHELFSKYDKFGVKEYKKLASFADKCGITFLTTCFDEQFVNELDEVLPAYKIASADITHYPLLKLIAKKRKPVILSTGAANLGEMSEAVNILKSSGCKEIAILHCVLNYPCPPEKANLLTISRLKTIFPDLVIGYSDHVPPYYNNLQLSIAWMLGARIIEKHFTLNKKLPGNDHYHAMDPKDIIEFRKQQEYLEKLLIYKDVLLHREDEQAAIKYARRSLVANVEIKKGQTIRRDMIAAKRPGTGIEPKYLDLIIGATAKKNIPQDTILDWSIFIDYANKT